MTTVTDTIPGAVTLARRSPAALDRLPAGILIDDVDGTYANPAFRRIFGLGPDDEVDWDAIEWSLERLDRDDPDGRSVLDGLAAEPTTSRRYRFVRGEGSAVVVRIAAARLGDPGDEAEGSTAAGVVALVSDESTRDDVERLRDAFLGVVGHELRTPITSIVCGAALLRGDGLAGEVRDEVAGTLIEEAHRLDQLVDQLIELAHLERSGGPRSIEPVQVRHIARRLAADHLARQPGVAIEVTTAPGLIPPVAANDGFVRQALTILVDNAARYAGSDAAIEIHLEAVAGAVRVHVLDNGPGLPDDGRDDLFRLFHRGPAREQLPAPGGTGIGLFVARAIVDALGGRIWATNRRDGGADVGFELPAIES